MKAITPPKMTVIPDKKIVKDDCCPTPNGKREIDPRPEFSVSADILPAIKDWSVGKKYMIEIEAEMIGSRIEDWGDDKGKLKGNFKISGIAVDADKDESGEGMNKGGTVKKNPETMESKKDMEGKKETMMEKYPEGMRVKKK